MEAIARLEQRVQRPPPMMSPDVEEVSNQQSVATAT
jgi:hypothetical protein